MRVAVITDIHANLPALEAVLGAIESIGVDALYCGGDLVGYGPQPNEVCALDRGARASRPSTGTTTTPSAATSRTAAAPTSPRTTGRSASNPWTGHWSTRTRAPRRSCAICPSTCASPWASGGCAWSTARRARSTSTCSRTSPPRSTSAWPPRPSATCWSSATPTSPGSTSTAACCSSTAARWASPRTATRAPPSRLLELVEGRVEASIERVPYDAEAVAREVEAVGLPARVRREARRGRVGPRQEEHMDTRIDRTSRRRASVGAPRGRCGRRRRWAPPPPRSGRSSARDRPSPRRPTRSGAASLASATTWPWARPPGSTRSATATSTSPAPTPSPPADQLGRIEDAAGGAPPLYFPTLLGGISVPTNLTRRADLPQARSRRPGADLRRGHRPLEQSGHRPQQPRAAPAGRADHRLRAGRRLGNQRGVLALSGPGQPVVPHHRGRRPDARMEGATPCAGHGQPGRRRVRS